MAPIGCHAFFALLGTRVRAHALSRRGPRGIVPARASPEIMQAMSTPILSPESASGMPVAGAERADDTPESRTVFAVVQEIIYWTLLGAGLVIPLVGGLIGLTLKH